jgi:hypothetical protein
MAANVLAPCTVTLEHLGYSVSNQILDMEEIWIAEKDENFFRQETLVNYLVW